MSSQMTDAATATETSEAADPAARVARWSDYAMLLKPRVMSLVVFTALTGLVCAGALNMWYDADIDRLMRRTRSRPVPAGRVQAADALATGIVLSLLSVGLMGLALNWLAAGLLAFTILFYAVVYTMWLKRFTPQNIVIGGAAGALPPVIGWAAASGNTPLNAWLLFLIIFLWTPPHSWALALYTSGDYAKAGVPMMPVAKGAASTRRQILLYSLVFVPVALLPSVTGLGGPLYLVVSAAGGALFLLLAARVALSRVGDDADPRMQGLYDVKPDARPARNMFAFSILYLFALFASLLAEHLFGIAPLRALL